MVPVENQAEANGAYHKHRPDEDEGPSLSRGGEHHSRQAQHSRQHVCDGHRLLLGKAHIDEAVVNVPPVRLHGVLVLGQAADDGKADVKNGDAQHQEGHGKGDDGIQLEHPLDGQGGQNKSQECGACVPHKDLGGVKIIGQEPQAGPQKGSYHNGNVALRH